ncbi:unnamed protein product [Lepeophtheirus salmonis]|uniref:(salmon louse) hypothetical protein n=1 Tax=Lepeophtheirus salmonis TaxID=72036 RepID=A0A7R8H5A6_LEPSM|nr:unnamed protein product [Lepeophtheirus salmonis]CAF2873251.1 unnamed protein product [Lepeophtheirus salmonis]
MYVSFEHSPSHEAWYNTYFRNDSSLTQPRPSKMSSLLLPYEMPISKFYYNYETAQERLSKAFERKQRSLNINSDMKKLVLPKNCTNDDIGRKSPRCHPSTQSLLLCENDPENSLFDDMSNDSLSIRSSSVEEDESPKKHIGETIDEIQFISHKLDAFLRQEIVSDTCDGHNGKKKRSSVDDLNDRMDDIVAGNVDSVLLDCLEDELPSVSIGNDNDPMSLLCEVPLCKSFMNNLHSENSVNTTGSESTTDLEGDEDEFDIMEGYNPVVATSPPPPPPPSSSVVLQPQALSPRPKRFPRRKKDPPKRRMLRSSTSETVANSRLKRPSVLKSAEVISYKEVDSDSEDLLEDLNSTRPPPPIPPQKDLPIIITLILGVILLVKENEDN